MSTMYKAWVGILFFSFLLGPGIAPADMDPDCAGPASAAPAGSDAAGVIIDPGLTREFLLKSASRGPVPGLAVESALLAQGRVRCRIQLEEAPADPASAISWLEEAIPEAQWEGSYGRWAQVVCPIGQVELLKGFPQAEIIARPASPFPQAMTQGTEILKAPSYWSRGFDGKDVTVAIVDVGFDGYQYELGSNLPENVKVKSFYHTHTGNVDITGGRNSHGLLVAEIIHDVAPAAQILLTNFGTLTELGQSVNWAIAEGAQVINHSVGWFDGPRDGTGDIASVAQSALDRGVVWVNSAGNYGGGHWNGTYKDQDRDGFLELNAADSETIALGTYRRGRVVSILLWWSQWPDCPDYHLDIQLWEGAEYLASSFVDYGFFPYAIRGIYWVADHDTELLTLKIIRSDDERDPINDLAIELYRLDGDTFPVDNDPTSSLIIPADVPGVIAVGAVDWENGGLEDYSSWGPTLSGLEKPELVSSSNVSTSAGFFAGTSASSPHVAGAAALLYAAAPKGGMSRVNWTVEELRGILQRSAEPAGFEFHAVDWGVAVLPLSPADLTESDKLFEVQPNPSHGGSVTLRWAKDFHPPESLEGTLRLYDVSGRLVWRTPGPVPLAEASISFRSPDGERPAAGAYWLKLSAPGVQSTSRVVLLRDSSR